MRVGWLVVALALVSGCKGEGERKQAVASKMHRGLDAVPAEVSTVIEVDVARLAKAPLARRAVGEMLARDPELAKRLTTLMTGCKLEVGKDVGSLVIAMGTERSDSLLVASGRFQEAALASCVGKAATAAGGEMTQTAQGDHTVYRVVGSPKAAAIFFTVSSADTVVVASSSDLLAQSLGDGPKLSKNHRMGELLARADRSAAVWAVGLVPTDLAATLVGPAGLKQPPQAIALDASLDGGLKARLQVEMVADEDAKALVSLAKTQLEMATWLAHKQGLSELVSKIAISADGRWVELSLNLPQAELGEILARLHRTVDSPESPQQNPPSKPPTGGEQE